MKQIIKSVISFVQAKMSGIQIGKNVYLGYFSKYQGKKRICLKNDVKIMPFSMLVCRTQTATITFEEGSLIGLYGIVSSRGKIVIGKDVLMGQNVTIADNTHSYEDINIPISKSPDVFIPKADGSPNIYIGEGSWIGKGAFISGNVIIGKHCVIGSYTIIKKNVPDYCVVVGCPARIVKRFDKNQSKWLKVNELL